MTFGIVFERARENTFEDDFFYAHVPALGLTTHGSGIEGARAAAHDLVSLWIAEKRAVGEPVEPSTDIFFSTLSVEDDALQSA